MKASVFLILICFFCLPFLSEAQSWQNITQKKGGYGLSDIIQDKTGNLYVHCPTGVFKSADNGTTWSKLGKGLYDTREILTENSPYKSQLLFVQDTLHLLYNQFSLTTYSDVYLSVYYEKGSNSWKKSNVKITNPPDAEESETMFFQTSGLIGYNDNGIFYYSSDGMKTWKSSVFSKSSLYSLPTFPTVVLDNKFYILFKDSVFVTKNGSNVKVNRIVNTDNTVFYSFGNVSQNILGTGMKTDSLIAGRLDTLNLKWIRIRKTKSSVAGNKISPNGNLYSISFYKILRSKNWGETWEELNLKPAPVFPFNNFTPIPFETYLNEIGGKAYVITPYNFIQSAPDLTSLNFQYTAPESFDYQRNEAYFYQKVDVSKNYIGLLWDDYNCREDMFYEKPRWNGSWQQLNSSLPNCGARTIGNGINSKSAPHLTFTSNYILSEYKMHETIFDYSNFTTSEIITEYHIYISRNEGATWDSLIYPIPKKEILSFTELNNVFYAVFKDRKSDTLFVTSDFGKNWQIKKTPVLTLTGTETFSAELDFTGNDLYLLHSQGKKSKIYNSSNQGSTWEDITFNLPQDGSVFSLDYDNFLSKNFSLPTLFYFNSTFKNYQYNKLSKNWSLLDSSYFYQETGFKMDTSLRAKYVNDITKTKYSELYKTELSYNNRDWISIDETIGKLEKNDTLFFAIYHNANGIYARTNYGLFHLPYSAITGLEENNAFAEKNGYVLYPNPSSTSFNIMPKGEKISVYITDLQGKELQHEPSWITDKPFDISLLREGIYYIKVKGKQEKVFKFIKN